MTSEARLIYEPGNLKPVGKARVRQTVLDRLHEEGKLSDEEHEAGSRYASLVFAYRKLIIAAPRPTVPPRSLQGLAGGRNENSGDEDWERLNRLREAYDGLWLALVSGKEGSKSIKRAVDQLCLDNEFPHSMSLARKGLNIIRNKR